MLIVDWSLDQRVVWAIRVRMWVLEEVKVVLATCEEH